MDRQTRVQYLVGHYEHPRHKGPLPEAEVTLSGGNPGCGDVVKVHLRADAEGHGFDALTWEGEGCTISMAAASILVDRVHRKGLSLEEVLGFDYEEMIDLLGRDIVSSRPRCATLALGTLKTAVKRLRSERRLRGGGPEEPVPESGAPAGLVFGDEASARDAAGEGPAAPEERPGGI